MNVNRTEGCLWHTGMLGDEKEQSAETTGFIQMMAKMADTPERGTGKLALPEQQKQRYRLVGSSMEGLICEAQTQEGKTILKVLVPQRTAYLRLKHFFVWLNAGLLTAGHNVVLEVVYDADLS